MLEGDAAAATNDLAGLVNNDDTDTRDLSTELEAAAAAGAASTATTATAVAVGWVVATKDFAGPADNNDNASMDCWRRCSIWPKKLPLLLVYPPSRPLPSLITLFCDAKLL